MAIIHFILKNYCCFQKLTAAVSLSFHHMHLDSLLFIKFHRRQRLAMHDLFFPKLIAVCIAIVLNLWKLDHFGPRKDIVIGHIRALWAEER